MRAPVAMALMLLLVGQTVHADENADDLRARQLYDNGAILYDEGRYEDAIVAWQEAWNLSERPLLLYNIANAQERLGLWREALETLNRYRAFARPEERERLDRRINNLERRLAEDGAPVATATLPSATTTTTIPVDEVQAVRRTGWIPVAAYGVGGVGMISGTVFALQARSARDTASGLCMASVSGTICPDSATESLGLDSSRSLLADGAFLLGGLGIAGGTVAVALLDGSPVTITPRGLLFRGQF